jgi:hypothetical protein
MMKGSMRVVLVFVVFILMASAGAVPVGDVISGQQGAPSGDLTFMDIPGLAFGQQVPEKGQSPGGSGGSPGPEWSFATGAPVRDVDISDDGRLIAVGSLGNKLYLFNWKGTKLWEKDIPIANAAWPRTTHSVAISDGGRYVAAGASNSLVYLFDKAGNKVWSINTGFPVTTVDIAHNGRFVVAGSHSSSRFNVFDIDGNTLWSGSVACTVRNVRMDHNGKWIAVGTHCLRLYLYENLDATGGDGGSQIWVAKLNDAFVNTDISADGQVIAAGVDDPGDNLWSHAYRFDSMKDGVPGWSAADGSPVWCFQEPDDFYAVSVSPDGNYIVLGGTPANSGLTDGESDLFYRDSNVAVQSWNTGVAQSSDVSLNGKYTVIGNGVNVHLCAKDDPTPLWSYATGGTVSSVGISKAGKVVVAGSEGGSVYVFYN